MFVPLLLVKEFISETLWTHAFLSLLYIYFQEAWDALQDASKAAGLQLRKLDKKLERSLLQEHKAALTERLKQVEEPAEALSLAVPLLIAQVHSSSYQAAPYPCKV